MAATVITLSPRIPVAEIERRTRALVARDGVAELAADSADARQVAQLRRVARRMAADPGLECYLADRTDSATYLTVFMAGKRDAGWWGTWKGEPEDPGVIVSCDPG
jgi:hypothetical protein